MFLSPVKFEDVKVGDKVMVLPAKVAGTFQPPPFCGLVNGGGIKIDPPYKIPQLLVCTEFTPGMNRVVEACDEIYILTY